MYFNLSETTSDAAARCLAMIERHAPRLMKLGAPLPRQTSVGSGRPLPERQRMEILEWRRSSNKLPPEIAALTGCSVTTVRRVCKRARMPFVAWESRRQRQADQAA